MKDSNEWAADYEIKAHPPLWNRIIENRMLVFGGVIVIILILTATLGPYLSKYDPVEMDFTARLAPPSGKHWMGTDQFGRDTLVRIIYGARMSLLVGTIAILIGMGFGIILGALGGYFGGLLDEILMRIMDALLAFPTLLLAIGLVASIGPSMGAVSVSIGIINIPRFARVMRSSVLKERQKEYVEAARAIGQTHLKIICKHIGPSCLSPTIVMATVIFATAMIIEAALSFLGVGVPPPTPSWGSMLEESRRYLSQSVYLTVFPGIILSLAVLGFNFLGDGLRDLLDPRTYT